MLKIMRIQDYFVEQSLLLHVGNRNIKKMIEMALEGNTMLYRHSPIIINENHTKMTF